MLAVRKVTTNKGKKTRGVDGDRWSTPAAKMRGVLTLTDKGYKFLSAEVEYIPSTYTKLDKPEDIQNMGRMLEMFEESDDIQSVYHNWENEDDYE